MMKICRLGRWQAKRAPASLTSSFNFDVISLSDLRNVLTGYSWRLRFNSLVDYAVRHAGRAPRGPSQPVNLPNLQIFLACRIFLTCKLSEDLLQLVTHPTVFTYAAQLEFPDAIRC